MIDTCQLSIEHYILYARLITNSDIQYTLKVFFTTVEGFVLCICFMYIASTVGN